MSSKNLPLGIVPVVHIGKKVECPLCLKPFERRLNVARKVEFWACDKDRIAIRVDDPFINRWDQAVAAAGGVECPLCNAKMRYFATSTGFMKAVCPKKGCGAQLQNVEADRGAQDVQVATPENPGTLQ